MSPLWGFRCLVYAACYKHAAPLGLNASLSPSLPFSLPPCNPLIRVIRDSDKEHLSPLWGFRCLVYAACYKHAAPLGLNARVHLSSSGWVTQPLRIQRCGSVVF